MSVLFHAWIEYLHDERGLHVRTELMLALIAIRSGAPIPSPLTAEVRRPSSGRVGELVRAHCGKRARIGPWVVVVSPDLGIRGGWRVTWFDDRGPVGHSSRDCRRACVELAVREFGRRNSVSPMSEAEWLEFQATWLERSTQ